MVPKKEMKACIPFIGGALGIGTMPFATCACVVHMRVIGLFDFSFVFVAFQQPPRGPVTFVSGVEEMQQIVQHHAARRVAALKEQLLRSYQPQPQQVGTEQLEDAAAAEAARLAALEPDDRRIPIPSLKGSQVPPPQPLPEGEEVTEANSPTSAEASAHASQAPDEDRAAQAGTDGPKDCRAEEVATADNTRKVASRAADSLSPATGTEMQSDGKDKESRGVAAVEAETETEKPKEAPESDEMEESVTSAGRRDTASEKRGGEEARGRGTKSGRSSSRRGRGQ